MLTTSLANGGAGLGTLGFHEAKAHELCSKAGFSSRSTTYTRRKPSCVGASTFDLDHLVPWLQGIIETTER
jgi:hypothetical protein